MFGEFVVIQVLASHVDGIHTGGEWVDYSRCLASEALVFMTTADPKRFRAVHWIDKTPLDARQLRIMSGDGAGQYADMAPLPGDQWQVTVVFQTNNGTRTETRKVSTWSGEPWQALINDLSRVSAETGEVIQSIKLD